MVDINDVERSPTNLLASGLTMAELSRAAYSSNSLDRAATARRLHSDVVGFVSDGSTQAFIVKDGTAAVVVVRGSEAPEDFVVDVSAVTAPGSPYPGAHAGFAVATELILDEVRSLLDPLLAAGAVREIWTTGHSLGGAVAQLLGWRLDGLGYPIGGVVAFGAPAPGQAGWSSEYTGLAARTHRWETADDIVPCFPFDPVWRQNGNMHELRPDEAVLWGSGTRCALGVHPPPSPQEVICDGGAVEALAIMFGVAPPWYCSIPDLLVWLTDTIVLAISGEDSMEHPISIYDGRLQGMIPNQVRALTGL